METEYEFSYTFRFRSALYVYVCNFCLLESDFIDTKGCRPIHLQLWNRKYPLLLTSIE